MQRRLLIITKNPEFDERGEVVLGQCEPFTSGWRLILVHPTRDREELLAGTYTDLRRIQESCTSLDDMDDVRRRVEEMKKFLTSSVTETVAVEFGSDGPPHESTKILEPTQTGMMAAVPEGATESIEDGFFELRETEGVMVALIADPDRASDVALLNNNLKKLLDRRPRAIVIDLSRIQNMVSRAVNEFLHFRDACGESEVRFGLCNVRKNVKKLFENLETENLPQVFEDSEAAVAEIGAT